MQWEDAASVQQAVANCDNVWDSIPVDKVEILMNNSTLYLGILEYRFTIAFPFLFDRVKSALVLY